MSNIELFLSELHPILNLIHLQIKIRECEDILISPHYLRYKDKAFTANRLSRSTLHYIYYSVEYKGYYTVAMEDSRYPADLEDAMEETRHVEKSENGM